MKHVILLGDGMADYPLDELHGKTVLEVAHTPAMDRIAREGTLGLVDTIPEGMAPGSDVANLTVLGYDPRSCPAGRGALEAVGMGIPLAPDDTAFRCNLVTLRAATEGNLVMEDFSAGHIATDEAKQLIGDLEEALGGEDFSFSPGVGYRHLAIWKKGPRSLTTTPPHDIMGQPIDEHLPVGDGAERLKDLMRQSREILINHPLNQRRISRGEKPASSLWFWGQGGVPPMKTLAERYGIRGAVISAVDLLKGIGVCAGLKPLFVAGATGYIDTNYRGKAEAALRWLEEGDFVFLHVEAPDEMGHEGNRDGKIKAIEAFDREVVSPVLAGLESGEPFRLMVLSDHATPVSVRTHVADPSPFGVLSSVRGENRCGGDPFGEPAARRSGILLSPGYVLMEYFMNNWNSFVHRARQ